MISNAPLISLLGYTAWTMLLVLAIVTWRGLEILRGHKKLNEFPAGVEHGSTAYWRLYRAHANSVENLPIVIALVLAGLHLHATGGAFDRAAMVALVARIAQSLVHVSSGSVPATTLRFTAFATQYVCFAVMLVQILRSL
ncbi:MAG: hypothetical protein JWN44_6941 [Myxococcales bacterium]|nr:hypothetical protein [Myxococcales bacterium]